MDAIDRIFYINLHNKTERKEHLLEQCVKHCLPMDKVERFEAIDGSTYEFSKQERDMFMNADFIKCLKTASIIYQKMMGNQLSHYNILKIMKERNYENIIILQDDVIFKDNFVSYVNRIMANIPEDAEIINIGMHKIAHCEKFEGWDLTSEDDSILIERDVTDFVCEYKIYNPITRYRVNPASLAYIVTKKGCQKLLDYFEITGFLHATDWNYNLYLQSKNIFYGSKLILCTGNNNFPSDVFVDTDNYPLEMLVNINFHYTDKNTTHSYYDLYNKLLEPIRKIAKNVLEIGIGNFGAKNGGSVHLWSLYFKNAQIYTADIIPPERAYDIIRNNPNITMYTNTDAYDEAFVNREFIEKGVKFDMMLDDGPHTLATNCKFIELYSQLMSETGILIIEDVQKFEWTELFYLATPPELRKYIKIYDLRHKKGRYDDIVFTIDKVNPSKVI